MNIINEGTISFWIHHEHTDWSMNSNGYNFGSVRQGEITASVVKHPNKIIDVTIDGPFGKQFTFTRPVPEANERGVFVAVTWKNPEVTLYLNGQPADKATA
jgi:hypothetical protein